MTLSLFSLLLRCSKGQMSGWVVGGDAQGCSAVCTNAALPSAPDCQAARVKAVSSCALMRIANAAIAAEGRTPMPGQCSTCVLDSNAPNPAYQNGKCHAMNSNNVNSASCAGAVTGARKLCCCGPGTSPATAAGQKEWCALQASDCSADTVWEPTTYRCMPVAVAACPTNYYLKTQPLSAPQKLCVLCPTGMTSPSGSGDIDACVCPAGAWRDSVTDAASPVCVDCAIGSWGPAPGGTSAAAACKTGSDCAAGRYASSLSVAGMSACAACGGTSGASTPEGSDYCTSPTLSRWYFGATSQTCTEACDALSSGSTSGTLRCKEAQAHAVNAQAAIEGVGAALNAEGRDSFTTPCATYSARTDIFAPWADAVKCVADAGGYSTCLSSSNGRRRICCCAADGENAAELCATKEADCALGKSWKSDAGRCAFCAPGKVRSRLTFCCFVFTFLLFAHLISSFVYSILFSLLLSSFL